MTVYNQYVRDRNSWFLGMTGPQVAGVGVGATPMLLALFQTAWFAVIGWFMFWIVVIILTVVPVKGRSTAGWVAASLAFLGGSLLGWNSFSARASAGVSTPGKVDLPGVLESMAIHEGPPIGDSMERPAVIQNHAQGTWAVTAEVTHPGLDFTTAQGRDGFGHGLSDLLEAASKTELVDQINITVRVVPDDGAERDDYIQRHARPDAPELSKIINADLVDAARGVGVRVESYLTLVVPERAVAKQVRGRRANGLDARAQVLVEQTRELESHLTGGVGIQRARWLSSPELAVAVRTGFAPEDRASIIDARAAKRDDAQVNADVPLDEMGPARAHGKARHFSHGRWSSVASTMILPGRGAVMGAIAPILTPTYAEERRSFTVCYPILSQDQADKVVGKAGLAADISKETRQRMGAQNRAKHLVEGQTAGQQDRQLVQGATLVRPYGIAVSTSPNTHAVGEVGRRLDASIRRAGFTPLRLDLAQALGFAAGVLPVGVSLTRKKDR